MTKSRVIAVILAILLLAGGVTLKVNPAVLDAVSWSFSAAKVEKAWIVYESTDNPKLPQSQIIAIQKAYTLGIEKIDRNQIGADDKVPAVLADCLNAVKDKPLPQYVRKWSNGKITAMPMPLTLEKLKEAK